MDSVRAITMKDISGPFQTYFALMMLHYYCVDDHRAMIVEFIGCIPPCFFKSLPMSFAVLKFIMLVDSDGSAVCAAEPATSLDKLLSRDSTHD
jgi:hypothetical protein